MFNSFLKKGVYCSMRLQQQIAPLPPQGEHTNLQLMTVSVKNHIPVLSGGRV